MNNSKKLQVKKVKEVKLSEKPITSVSKPWLITSIVIVALLIGALLFDQLYEPTLMTIDGKKYQLDDVSYYFYNVESTYSYYDQMLSGGYWDTVADEESGKTVRDMAKDEAVNESIQKEILYNEAKSNDYELTSEEKETISDNVNTLLTEQLSPAVKKKNNFTKAYLTKVLGKMTLADRYRKDQIEALNIDEDKIKDGIKYDDYRQYNIQLLYISTQTTDTEGNTVDFTAKEKTAANDKIKGIYDKAKSTEDWSKLLPTDEKELKYQESNFIESDSTYSDDFEAMMMKMENDEISSIYEDTTGYYIVRMVDNNSDESYNSAVDQAITSAEDTAFTELYDTKIKKAHKYSTNKKALKSLSMGTLTLAN